MIQEKAITGNYVVKRKLVNYAEANFRANLTYGWIRSFLELRTDFLRETIVAPGELPRLQVPRQYLNQSIGFIKNWVSLIPDELIYNLDETGLSDWKDSKSKPVAVPTL
jgi:hypothetical protein